MSSLLAITTLLAGAAPAAAVAKLRSAQRPPRPSTVSPVRVTAQYTGTGTADAARIDRYLRRNGSPMTGLGRVFVRLGLRYRISPYLMVGIAGIESSLAKTGCGPASAGHNPFGWNSCHTGFASYVDAIRTLASHYAGAQNPWQIAHVYNPGHETFWASHVSWFMEEAEAA